MRGRDWSWMVGGSPYRIVGGNNGKLSSRLVGFIVEGFKEFGLLAFLLKWEVREASWSVVSEKGGCKEWGRSTEHGKPA